MRGLICVMKEVEDRKAERPHGQKGGVEMKDGSELVRRMDGRSAISSIKALVLLLLLLLLRSSSACLCDQPNHANQVRIESLFSRRFSKSPNRSPASTPARGKRRGVSTEHLINQLRDEKLELVTHVKDLTVRRVPAIPAFGWICTSSTKTRRLCVRLRRIGARSWTSASL